MVDLSRIVKGGKGSMTPCEIYAAALAVLPLEDIEHHNSDLYLRKTNASKALVKQLDNKALLTTFRSYDGSIWYELPFCYSPYWENPSEHY